MPHISDPPDTDSVEASPTLVPSTFPSPTLTQHDIEPFIYNHNQSQNADASWPKHSSFPDDEDPVDILASSFERLSIHDLPPPASSSLPIALLRGVQTGTSYKDTSFISLPLATSPADFDLPIIHTHADGPEWLEHTDFSGATNPRLRRENSRQLVRSLQGLHLHLAEEDAEARVGSVCPKESVQERDGVCGETKDDEVGLSDEFVLSDEHVYHDHAHAEDFKTVGINSVWLFSPPNSALTDGNPRLLPTDFIHITTTAQESKSSWLRNIYPWCKKPHSWRRSCIILVGVWPLLANYGALWSSRTS